MKSILALFMLIGLVGSTFGQVLNHSEYFNHIEMCPAYSDYEQVVEYSNLISSLGPKTAFADDSSGKVVAECKSTTLGTSYHLTSTYFEHNQSAPLLWLSSEFDLTSQNEWFNPPSTDVDILVNFIVQIEVLGGLPLSKMKDCKGKLQVNNLECHWEVVETNGVWRLEAQLWKFGYPWGLPSGHISVDIEEPGETYFLVQFSGLEETVQAHNGATWMQSSQMDTGYGVIHGDGGSSKDAKIVAVASWTLD